MAGVLRLCSARIRELADGCAEQPPDSVGEAQAERSTDDQPQDGAADVTGSRRSLSAPVRPRVAKVTGTRSPAGGRRMANIGSRAPDTNDSAEAPAAWIGLGMSAGIDV